MTMGSRINEARRRKGYTQEYVALTLGVSRQAVYKWERDLAKPDTNNLIALSNLLDTTVDYLLCKEAVCTVPPVNPGAFSTSGWILVLLAILTHWICVFCGLFDEMAMIPLRNGGGLGVWWLWYGETSGALAMQILIALMWIAAFVLFFIARRIRKQK